ATFLCSLNPILIHMGPFAKEDVPGLFFFTIAVYLYLKNLEKQKIKYFILTGIFIGLTIGTRYNLPPPLFTIIAANELITQRPIKNLITKCVYFFCLPICILFLIPAITFSSIGITSFVDGFSAFFRELYIQFHHFTNATQESHTLNYIFLLKSFTYPLSFLGLIGFIHCCIKKTPGTFFFGQWFFVFFIFQTYAINHTEARYLFPAFPPLCFFIAHGIDFVFSLITSNLIKKTVLFLFLMIPYISAIIELSKFQDPFYKENKEKEASLIIEKNLLSINNRVFWVGEYYSFFPKEHYFDEEDGYTYLYHFDINAVRFYTSKKIKYIKISKTEDDLLFQENLIAAINHEDLVVDSAKEMYITKTIPLQMPPLQIKKTNILNFIKTKTTLSSVLFSSENNNLVQIKFPLDSPKKELILQGKAITPGKYAVLIESKDQKRIYCGNLEVDKKGVAIFVQKIKSDFFKQIIEAEKASLLSFEVLKIFYHSSS
ncbi:MAG: glycosyltransferase family 39 protein, partial [Deltaproteobacteria bacterium]|nr:glycosyltransferase family 39 protein [Deltaproteobacteria bacterium]